MSIVIGLSGENCAGKGTVAEYLKKKSFYYLSLSDIIREELKEEGKEITRTNLIDKGNELRNEFGPGVLATKTAAKVEKDKNYVIDSIRNPAEAKELKKIPGFVLFYVTASPDTRFDRMKSRDREEDPKTLEAFQKIEKIEAGQGDKTKQDLLGTIQLADKTIENNSDLNELYSRIDKALAQSSEDFKLARPSWDDYFMGIAKQVASRSNCVKRKVAAIIVRDKRIVSTGYNGTPRGTKNCNEGGCPRCNNFSDAGKSLEECYCSHGEENSIVQASYHGISIKGATIYTTFSPCLLCTKMIINAGLSEVIYNAEYPMNEVPLSLLREAGVMVRQVRVK
jgi:dCMP deaminase